MCQRTTRRSSQIACALLRDTSAVAEPDLSNFEHVLAAAPLVTELLAASPDLRVLVTSQARLELRDEEVLALRLEDAIALARTLCPQTSRTSEVP